MAEVLIRAADAGDTYLAWRWLDALDDPSAERLDAVNVVAALKVLDASLITPLDEERGLSDAQRKRVVHERAMVHGAFMTHAREHAMARDLASAILPDRLVAEIKERQSEGVRIRLTPSPRLARVPWETLVIHARSDKRLIEVADIVYDPPATVRSERSVVPDSWANRASLPGIWVIDPDTGTAKLPRILVKGDQASKRFEARLLEYTSAGLTDPSNDKVAVSSRVSRARLRAWLTPHRSRFFYYGHVSSEPDEPGSAALHLSDPAKTWGMATELADHRPLSALDLLLGTMVAGPAGRSQFGSDEGLPGHQLWPMPPRVAVIACEGGADFRSSETFGLVIAMLNSGAELVTTTRWTMPTDVTFWDHHASLKDNGIQPTTDLALTVDAAHGQPDAIRELTRWQRRQLESWRERGELANTPMVWASLINTWAPA